MKKRKLFIVLSAILALSLMGLSVACLAPGETSTMRLEIYDGPNYSESYDICYYKVEAIVTGMPEPEIEFDLDDNVDLIGNSRVEVFVEAGKSYTLIATATNSAGTASVSIPLSGKCREEVAESKDNIEEEDAGEVVDEGTKDNISEEVKEESEPEESSQEEAAKEEDVEEAEEESETGLGVVEAEIVTEGTDDEELVEKERGYRVINTVIRADKSMSGLIAAGGTIRHGTSPILIGDTTVGSAMKGFLSFNISELHGDCWIVISNIEFKRIFRTNRPGSFASNIIVEAVDYEDSLDIHDFYTVGWTFLDEIPITATSHSIMGVGPDFDDTVPIRYELQKAVDEGKDYFQIRLQLDVTTNGNSVIDSKDINDCDRDVWLLVTYHRYF